MQINPRQIALDCLQKVIVDNGYSNLVLDKALTDAQVNNRDKAFISALFYGVLERKITIDHIIAQFSKTDIKKVDKTVLTIMRMGVYQIVFMDKIPLSASVNESVSLVKNLPRLKNRQVISGYTNGVLRNIARAIQTFEVENEDSKDLPIEDKLEKIFLLPPQKNFVNYMSVKYSCPKWLVKMWQKSYGKENCRGILSSLSGRPPITCRVNNTLINEDDFVGEMKMENVIAKKNSVIDNSFNLAGTHSIERLQSYKSGLFHIQDLASQLSVYAFAPQKGDKIIDVCSAPGGKSFTIAETIENDGLVVACDIYPNRIKLIDEGAKRLNLTSIKTALRDANEDVTTDEIEQYDKVLCDVPCSGLGILRRKPEIRFKKQEDLQDLPNLQYDILKKSSKLVKQGGYLQYSTCALTLEENNQVTKRFLEENSDFEPVVLNLPNDIKQNDFEKEYEITLFPHIHNCDGFYIAQFRKLGVRN